MTREVIIRTCRSDYHFVLLDPAGRLGLLSGGRLGAQRRDAMLVGQAGLRVGSRAVFDVAAGSGLRRVTTSRIRQIDLV